MRLPCFSHILQLVVSDGLKEASCIKQVLSKVSKIAKLSHSNNCDICGKTREYWQVNATGK